MTDLRHPLTCAVARGPLPSLLAALFFFLAPFPAAGVEYLTIPSEGAAKVTEGNYANARDIAIRGAFGSAVRLAAQSVTSAGGGGAASSFAQKPVSFVASYKLLSETIDQASGLLSVSLQVTVYLDEIRSALRQGGVEVKRASLPNLVILIEEKNADVVNNPNFILMNSLSEEHVSQGFRLRGYAVTDRKGVRRANAGQAALLAFARDREALGDMARSFEADLFLFGRTQVTVEKKGAQSQVRARVTINIVSVAGEELGAYTGEATGAYLDPLAGSLETIKEASAKAGNHAASATGRLWSQSRGR